MINGVLVDSITGELVPLDEILYRIPPRDMWAGLLAGQPNEASDWFEVARNVITSNDYLYYGSAFPDRNTLISPVNVSLNGIPPNEQVDGSITAYPASLLVSLTITSGQAEGVAVRIYDKDTQWDLFQGEFAPGNTVGEFNHMDPLLGPNDTLLDQRYVGQYFFPTAYMLGGDGVVQISITNLSGLYNIAQAYLNFAVPSKYAAGTHGVKRGVLR